MEDFMADPICCAPREDTFLAETKTKYGGSMRPGKTVDQVQAIERELVDCLDHPEKLVFG